MSRVHRRVSRRTGGRVLAGAVVLAAALAGFGHPAAKPVAVTSSSGSSTSTSATPSATSSTTAPRATTRTSAPKPAPHAASAHPRMTLPVVGAPHCAVPSGVTAAQVVLVRGSGTQATVRACHRTGSGYALDLGPYYGHVGINGVTWSKREGDLATPAGTFPLRGGFGIQANPGLPQGWFVVDANDVWVDDSASPLYNTHQRKPANGRWSSAENLLKSPAYTYAQVIGYNEARTPGAGSAIFFHVDLGHGTAGCVSLPSGALTSVFRWERAGAVMSIS